MQIDTDIAMQMIAKVARRLYKVDSLLQNNTSAPECLSLLARQSQVAVAASLERTRALLDERWAAIIEKERDASQLTPPPSHEQFLADTKHDVTEIKYHIDCLTTNSETQLPQTDYQPEPTESKFHHNFLYETEMLRLTDLQLRNCENIRELYENYLR